MGAAAQQAQQPAAAQPAASQDQAGKANGAASESANGQSQEEPDTLILSDTLNYNDAAKESTFTGNVVMTRGLMTLHADTLTMREDAEGFQHGVATVSGSGKRVKVRQENPEKFEVIEAEGVRGEYNGKTEEIEMIGQAVVTKFVCGKPFDTIRGERVKYNQTTNVYQAFGGPQSSAQGGRVRSLATPSAKAEAAAADCRKKSTNG
ncbi:lipopolysaccharide transport periplasmic protein LptA [Pusillimonas sp.]|uniref:lipopolysaccharide transport periplasmic protein LptA n=1 Tax=Pusillimonas sp. TaxID=3040095 RepID=UPI0039B8A08B